MIITIIWFLMQLCSPSFCFKPVCYSCFCRMQYIIIIFCLYNENQSDSVLYQTPLTFICFQKNSLWSTEERKSYRFGIKYCFTKHLRTFWPEGSVYISVLDSLNKNAEGWMLFCHLKVFVPPTIMCGLIGRAIIWGIWHWTINITANF